MYDYWIGTLRWIRSLLCILAGSVQLRQWRYLSRCLSVANTWSVRAPELLKPWNPESKSSWAPKALSPLALKLLIPWAPELLSPFITHNWDRVYSCADPVLAFEATMSLLIVTSVYLVQKMAMVANLDHQLHCIWNQLNYKLLGTPMEDSLDQIIRGRLFTLIVCGTFWSQPRWKDMEGGNFILCLFTLTGQSLWRILIILSFSIHNFTFPFFIPYSTMFSKP